MNFRISASLIVGVPEPNDSPVIAIFTPAATNATQAQVGILFQI
jgi:hypothetical protein